MTISRKAVSILICCITFVFTIVASVETTLVFTGLREDGLQATKESETTADSNVEAVEDVYKLLVENYYLDVDEQSLIEGAINGMLATLDDPYTFYYTAQQMEQTQQSRSGEFVGIGVSVTCTNDGNIYVIRSFKGSPAYEAGIIKGDIVVAVDGKTVSATNSDELDEVVSNIKGDEGTEVEIEFRRGEESFTVVLQRKALVSSRVDYQMLEGNVGYILLYDFFGSCVQEVADAVSYFEENEAVAIVLDLRDNGGGLVNCCNEIADIFLDESVIFYSKNGDGLCDYFNAVDGSTNLPLAVLINENSASASEILAGALQDNGRAIVVGKNSYGKGIMQTTYQLHATGTAVQLTTAEFFSPNGNSIHKTGIVPNIEIEPSTITFETYLEGVNPDNDAQLKAAYDYLLTHLQEDTGSDEVVEDDGNN